MAENKIPNPVIGLLGETFSEFYTHAEIDRVFTYADAPGEPPVGNKVNKTVDWLRRTNRESDQPLVVLGALLEDILEKEINHEIPYDEQPPYIQVLIRDRPRIVEALAKRGLTYEEGGRIASGTARSSATKTLKEIVGKGGINLINVEIERTLKTVGDDPSGAAHYAANVLEATMKFYLERRHVPFNDKADALPKLWQKVREDLGINPKNLRDDDLKLIASGLGKIIEGTNYIRDKKSGAHGRTEKETLANSIKPRHARLVVNSSHTLAVYILDCLADR